MHKRSLPGKSSPGPSVGAGVPERTCCLGAPRPGILLGATGSSDPAAMPSLAPAGSGLPELAAAALLLGLLPESPLIGGSAAYTHQQALLLHIQCSHSQQGGVKGPGGRCFCICDVPTRPEQHKPRAPTPVITSPPSSAVPSSAPAASALPGPLGHSGCICKTALFSAEACWPAAQAQCPGTRRTHPRLAQISQSNARLGQRRVGSYPSVNALFQCFHRILCRSQVNPRG